ncbi:LytR family transcriptional regulator [Crassaminicella thermophila]|uniref:LytR family transcriptional regulator n=1 Tax=Crassaminicella thermophila TaxID=2599308 RepID=A0A5C0SCU7_CRATE|nr:LCP family protein [Crassaminicella thermophila]QEK12041.1 LytR family transcriptional regulator [Crassaminicella thermophila]
MKKFLKVLIIAFICFVVVMTSGTYIFLNSISKGDSYSHEKPVSEDALPKKKERVNVLIVGVDAKDSKSSKYARTDTIMLATFNPDTKKIDLISIPRDTRTVIRGRTKKDKINHAHVYGGINLSMKAVKDLLGVPVHYYVKINYTGLAKIVDDVGGVEVDVPMDMHYYDPKADPPLKINLKKGRQVLDSNKAMQFLRFRKGYINQDLGRIDAQHTFLTALADKLLKPQIITKLPKLVKTFNTYVDTNMPITTMTSYALQAKDIKLEDINMITIPGESKLINGLWYYIPDMNKLQIIIDEIFNETYDRTKNVNTKKDTDLKKTTIEVLNGSNISGLATKIANKLRKEGYNVINISNVKGIKYGQTHIYDRKNKLDDTKKIADLLGVKEIEIDINMEAKADITIIVGSDLER